MEPIIAADLKAKPDLQTIIELVDKYLKNGEFDKAIEYHKQVISCIGSPNQAANNQGVVFAQITAHTKLFYLYVQKIQAANSITSQISTHAIIVLHSIAELIYNLKEPIKNITAELELVFDNDKFNSVFIERFLSPLSVFILRLHELLQKEVPKSKDKKIYLNRLKDRNTQLKNTVTAAELYLQFSQTIRTWSEALNINVKLPEQSIKAFEATMINMVAQIQNNETIISQLSGESLTQTMSYAANGKAKKKKNRRKQPKSENNVKKVSFDDINKIRLEFMDLYQTGEILLANRKFKELREVYQLFLQDSEECAKISDKQINSFDTLYNLARIIQLSFFLEFKHALELYNDTKPESITIFFVLQNSYNLRNDIRRELEALQKTINEHKIKLLPQRKKLISKLNKMLDSLEQQKSIEPIGKALELVYEIFVLLQPREYAALAKCDSYINDIRECIKKVDKEKYSQELAIIELACASYYAIKHHIIFMHKHQQKIHTNTDLEIALKKLYRVYCKFRKHDAYWQNDVVYNDILFTLIDLFCLSVDFHTLDLPFYSKQMVDELEEQYYEQNNTSLKAIVLYSQVLIKHENYKKVITIFKDFIGEHNIDPHDVSVGHISLYCAFYKANLGLYHKSTDSQLKLSFLQAMSSNLLVIKNMADESFPEDKLCLTLINYCKLLRVIYRTMEMKASELVKNYYVLKPYASNINDYRTTQVLLSAMINIVKLVEDINNYLDNKFPNELVDKNKLVSFKTIANQYFEKLTKLETAINRWDAVEPNKKSLINDYNSDKPTVANGNPISNKVTKKKKR